MTLLQALILGLVQGATEFLPVSSSGHLVLLPWLLGWPDPGLAFDVLVHWGTAVAVIVYFWRDWLALAGGAWCALRTRSLSDPNSRLVVWIVLGTIPGAIAGALLDDFFEMVFGEPAAAAAFLLVTAAFLAAAERWSQRRRALADIAWLDALLVGLAQAVAILPGISRSGSTISTGMARGLERPAAARFSFLLATPIILGAGALKLLDLVQGGVTALQLLPLAIGFVAALLTGLACIHWLLRYLSSRSLYPFALYCALVGATSLLVYFVR